MQKSRHRHRVICLTIPALCTHSLLRKIHVSGTQADCCISTPTIFWDCDLPTSIEETVENRIKFNVEKDRLNISGNPDSTIRIYSIKGILCAEVQPTGEDNMNIDVTNLERGTYIVKISDFTFKFLKQ